MTVALTISLISFSYGLGPEGDAVRLNLIKHNRVFRWKRRGLFFISFMSFMYAYQKLDNRLF